MNRDLLYVTADGLLEPLGFSQVVRVVESLGRRRWPYSIFSLEKPKDLSREGRVRDVRARLKAAGVDWRFSAYETGGAVSAAVRNEGGLIAAATRTRGLAGIHARAYHGAVAAFAAWLGGQTPYVFDARSYWFDERLEEGRWFTTPIKLGVARGIERQLFARARAVVTLTEIQADDVRSGRFGPSRHRIVECITTCADFNDFVRRPAAGCERVPEWLRRTLTGRRVLGIIGSINRSYLVEETLELAAAVLRRDENAHLLILTVQQDEYLRRLAARGLAETRFTIARAEHDEMPEWLSLIDWGMLLLSPSSPAKRASMPTKLAEFLACGVRPVQFGCNSEVTEWVRRTGSGFVLRDVRPETLEAAAERIVSTPLETQRIADARARAAPHFSLEAGIAKYEEVLLRTFGDLRRS